MNNNNNNHIIHNKGDWEIICELSSNYFKVKKLNGDINGLKVDICTFKIIEKDKFRIEIIDILNKLNDNEYLFKYYGYGIDDENYYYIYSEFINDDGISINEKIKQLPLNRFDEQYIRLLIIDIIIGLQSIHENNIIYNNLNSNNIILFFDKESNQLIGMKFIGFELSYMLSESSSASSSNKTDIPVSKKSDIYSLGCLLIKMAGGTINQHNDPIIPNHLSFNLKNIIQHCLVYKKARIDLSNLLNLFSNREIEIKIKNQNHYIELESFNEPLKSGIIKDGVRFVSLPKFNEIIQVGSIPKSVTSLKLTNYNLPLITNTIPESVTSLSLGNNITDIDSIYSYLPNSIIDLQFGVDQTLVEIDINRFKSSISSIIINGEQKRNNSTHFEF